MKRFLSLLSCIVLAFGLGGCGDAGQKGENGQGGKNKFFENSGFELGTLEGWETNGTAFGDACIESQESDVHGNRYYKEGTYFFHGRKAGLSAVGTMKSPVFRLSGNGKIGFLIGAGADTEKCYVALCDSDGNELVRKSNPDFLESDVNTMHRVMLDGSSFTGMEVYIMAVDSDNRTTGYNYLVLDDFVADFKGGEESSGKLFSADKYIAENISRIKETYRHTYHAMPPVGWMNDPNGLVYAFGKYHLFFQFYPYSPDWGPMHWGHYTSEDLVNWKLEKTALAPDREYDKDGCFSGTALVHDGKLYLMYTAVSGGKQTQSLAVSDDGVNFKKSDKNPIISTDQLPPGIIPDQFRDPKLFKRDETFYALIGARNTDYNGQLLLYRSLNLLDWNYVGTSVKDGRTTKGIYECPDFIGLAGQDIIITSPQGMLEDELLQHENLHSNLYMAGGLNLSTGKFTVAREGEIDGGTDFYAPQTLQTPDGRTVLIAWMQMWDRTMPTKAHGWAGAMTLPRELSYKDGRLFQKPVSEIENFRDGHVSYSDKAITSSLSLNGVSGQTVELDFELDPGTAEKCGVRLFKNETNETLVYYNAKNQTVVFDRTNSGEKIVSTEHSQKEKSASIRTTKVSAVNGRIRFRIFLDRSSVEVFVNDGAYTLTGNVYASAAQGIEFFADGGSAKLVKLDKYDIKLPISK